MASICLIHGVNSNGEWFEDVSEALRPHFDPVPVRYAGYRKMGLLKVASFGGGVLSALAAVVAALLIRSTAVVWTSAVFVVVGLTISATEWLRRDATVSEVRRQLSNAQRNPEEHVHVIAHSFGTLMLTKALPRTSVSLRHVILASGILRRDFDWHRLWRKNAKNGRPSFRWVRNEHGSRDAVVRAAALLCFATGGGASGVSGFVPCRKNPIVIHNVADPFGPCLWRPHCHAHPIVHNHSLSEYRHSDGLDFLHATLFWLPHLLGFEPQEMGRFRMQAAEIVDYIERHNATALRLAIANFGRTSWTWTATARGRTSLREFLRVAIVATRAPLRKSIDDHLDEAVQWTARYTGLGYNRKADERDPRYSDPRVAMNDAVQHTLTD